MRRPAILAAASLAAALAASFSAGAALADPGAATGDVNLRARPSVHSEKLATIPAGAAVEIITCPRWCQVTYRGHTGWASAKYISAAGPATTGSIATDYIGPRPRIYFRGWPPFYYDIPYQRNAADGRANRYTHGPTVPLYYDF
jgi:uncharacterized protein YraI